MDFGNFGQNFNFKKNSPGGSQTIASGYLSLPIFPRPDLQAIKTPENDGNPILENTPYAS
jgi:hypothetical protein